MEPFHNADTLKVMIEHDLFGIPRPDACIVLHVPTKISIRLAEERGGWKGDIKTDIHETDPQWHL